MKKPFLALWLVAGGAVLFSWIYLPTLSRYQDLKTRQEGIEIQIKDLNSKLRDIREERDLLKNDVGYLEKVIREELGLVKPGEIVYKFVEEKPAVPSADESLAAGAKSAPKKEVAAASATSAPPVAAKKKQPETKPPALSVPAKLVPPAPKTVPVIQPESEPAPSPKETTAEAPADVYPRRETR